MSRQRFPRRAAGTRFEIETSRRESTIISEFYKLRRTAIKDIAAYLGFLAGFIGSAPFAWGRLAAELDAGRFARGLWYFFGIVTTAGIFAGIAGLGIGMAAGLVWEQIHRYRRGKRLRPDSATPPGNSSPPTIPTTGERPPSADEKPRLKLVSDSVTQPPKPVDRASNE